MHEAILTTLHDPEELAELLTPQGWPALSAETIRQQAPDASLVVRGGDGPRARCSLWWTDAPQLEGEHVGAIGHFAASDGDAARALLDGACAELRRRGCTVAVGPMDGNTWRSYRLVTEPGIEPPFFLEPTNPAEWPAYWRAAGFEALAHYTSALDTDLARRDGRADRAAERLSALGVTLRALDPDAFDDELGRIYSVAEVSFRRNFLYTPLAERAFAAQYRQVRPLVVPELVLLAEHEGRTVGFAFTIPDALERQRGERARTVIIKTVAILPELRYGGLGSWLVESTRCAAHRLGFERAVHALMHDANSSRSISGRTGAPMRGYTLFSRRPT
ncbi:MAG TPA: GNAT family N-acetyltransferase [Gemmatimonadales bacterium]